MSTSTSSKASPRTQQRHVVSATGGPTRNIGFDTLGLSVDYFEVTSDQDLSIDLGEQRQRRHLFCVGGRPVEGKRASFVDGKTGIRIAIVSDSKALVQFSGRAVNPSNYHLLGASELCEAAAVVEQVLENAGIRLKVGEARLSRLDMALNLLTDNTTGTAVDGIASFRHHMDPPRMQLLVDHLGSVLWGNTRRALAAYDKHAQMLKKGFDVDGIPSTLRLEYRLLRAETIRKDVEVVTLGQLFDKDRFNNVVLANLRTLALDLLPQAPAMTHALNMQRSGWTEALRQAHAISPRQKWCILSKGILASTVAANGEMQAFLAAAEDLFGRTQAREIRRKLMDVDKVGISTSDIHRALRRRYGALRSKLISTAWSQYMFDDQESTARRGFRPVPQWAIPRIVAPPEMS